MYASAFSDEEADPEEEDSQPKSPAFVIEEPEDSLSPRSAANQKDEDEAASRSSTPEMKERRGSDDVEKSHDANKSSTITPDKSRSYYFYQGILSLFGGRLCGAISLTRTEVSTFGVFCVKTVNFITFQERLVRGFLMLF